MSDETLFAQALALESSEERARFLDHACNGDAGRHQRLKELLSAAQGTNPLDQPANRVHPHRAPLAETIDRGPQACVGDRIGVYKLLEKIGEGGMGDVWVADQLEPITRRVALKLIKPGMDSRSVLGRFEAERQALAVMDHPNIAKVLDAGTTSDGRPYFVMELVKGTPITDFCDARKLTPQQRLQLFIPVCQAIQHAHMKGIIHRDIKPSNVLVALHDETPVPKIIDFGVAKAIGQQLTEKTIYTGFGTLVGTPTYMAPEQANFNQLDVDTRADVYALGVMLYELLTGSPPIDKDRIKKAAIDEVLRIVRDEEPPRPSQRLSTSQSKASIAATRQTEPARLSALMKGELDWIVMKALEKDRTRRYDSANGLAKDVERYLKGDAVEACPPTLGYRLSKAYRRNRASILIGSAFAALVLTAGILGTYLAIRANEAEKLARTSEMTAIEARHEAENERDNVTQSNKALNQNMDQLQRTRYAAEMNLVQAAYNNKDLELMNQTLLEQLPKAGQPDLRGPEWHYWFRRLNRFEKEFKLPINDLDSGFGNANTAIFSEDGSKLAYLSITRPLAPEARLTVTVWNTDTGAVLRSIQHELKTLVPNVSFKSNVAINFNLSFHQQGKNLLVNCYHPRGGNGTADTTSNGFNSDNIWNLETGEWKQLQFQAFKEQGYSKTIYSPNLDARLQLTANAAGLGRSVNVAAEVVHLPDGRSMLKQTVKNYSASFFLEDGKHVLIVRTAEENQLAGLGAMYMVPTITALWKLDGDGKPIWERRDDPREKGAPIARPVPRTFSLDPDGKTYTELQFTTKGTIAHTYSMETGKLEQAQTLISEGDLASTSISPFQQMNRFQTSVRRGYGAMQNRIAHISATGVAIRDLRMITSPIPDRDKVMDQEMQDGPPMLLALRADSTLVTLHDKQKAGYLRLWKIPGAMGSSRPLSMGVIDPKSKRMANLVFDLLFTDREMPRSLVAPKPIGLFVHDDSGKLLLTVPANEKQGPCPHSVPNVRAGFSTSSSNRPLFSRDGRYCIYVLRILGTKDEASKPEHDVVVIHDLSTGHEVARLLQEPGKAVYSVQMDDQQEQLLVNTGKKLIALPGVTAQMIKLESAVLYAFPTGKKLGQLALQDDKPVVNVYYKNDHWEGIPAQRDRTSGLQRITSVLHWERVTGKFLGEHPYDAAPSLQTVRQNEWTQGESQTFGNRVLKRFSNITQTRLELWDTDRQGVSDQPILNLLDRSLKGYLSPDGKRLIVFRDGSLPNTRITSSQDRATMYSTETGRPMVNLPWRNAGRASGELGCWSPDGLHFWTSVTTEGNLDGYDFRPWEIATK